MTCFFFNCHMLKKFPKIFGTKNTFVVVTLVPSLKHILTLLLFMIETLNLFPKLTSPWSNSFNCENNSFFTTHVITVSCIKIPNILAVYI